MKRRAFLLAIAAVAAAPSSFAQGKPLRIGVIGSGRIGSTLGALWVKAGHEVMFSDRDPEQVKRAMDGLGPRARAGSVKEAVSFGDAVLIAVPYGALPAIAHAVGGELKGKVVIDPNNPVPSRDGELGAQAKEKGAAISTAALLPGVRTVRAFNSWGYSTMAREANRPAPRMAIPVAADDAAALKLGVQLVSDAGFDPVPVNSLAASKAFDLGSSVSGKIMTADEMRKALSLQ
ncbi:MAG TPA: NAD(P)-binding domain-containing protein [Burkholderiales bacterium]|nr:NAD(P)-binding domain-containing protein [Burkholderiales bacterium]